MAYRYALAINLVAAALLSGAPSAASAQCRLCSTPTTDLQQTQDGGPIRLEVQTSLDFDRLVLLGASGGEARLLPNGDRSASGSVATVSARAIVGSVTVHGDANRTLRVEMPQQINLYSVTGGKIAVDEIETDLPSLPKLDSAGNLVFRFGGHLEITGDADGQYRGDIPITVDYL